MGTANRWTSQNGQQEGRNLNVNNKYTIRREKREKKISHLKKRKNTLNEITRRGKNEKHTPKTTRETRSKLTGMYPAHPNSMVGKKEM